jgi:hypothetical protein
MFRIDRSGVNKSLGFSANGVYLRRRPRLSLLPLRESRVLAGLAPMLGPLIAFALFCGVVWVVAQAIFMLLHVERDEEIQSEHRDPIATFVEENYGSHFMHDDQRGQGSLRKF